MPSEYSPPAAPIVPPSPPGALILEVATLIVESLQLEVAPTDIVPDAALFGSTMAAGDHSGGLGLDSIDALELALAISRKYGFDLKSDDERNQQIFASLENLTRTVEQRRTR